MAERRMFSKAIVQSSRFLKMPVSSRELYFQMGMSADDDGIVEAWNVMRITNAREDDLRVLVSKGYVQILDNEDLIAYLKDWNINNTIRKDRYHESIYKDLKVQVIKICGNQVTTNGQPSDSQCETEVRLDKDSIVKDSIEYIPPISPQGESEGKKTKRFVKPTVEQVQEYCDSRNNGISGQEFIDYYDSIGWNVGKKPMKDWQAAVRTWENKRKTTNSTGYVKRWNV